MDDVSGKGANENGPYLLFTEIFDVKGDVQVADNSQ